MHIPDGYLSPQTYIPLYGVFVAFTTIAIKKVKQKVENRFVPFIGMAAAFSFLVMMFNIPVPGGTTGHAIGAAIVSLLLGPWVTFISVSVALIIQAFLFGDGGITSLGANCINMALVMPFVSWYTFKFITNYSKSYKMLSFAAFMAGYLSINASALFASIELGIQPLIATDAAGNPLYAPYPLKVTIPAMVSEHLLIFGIFEGLITLFVFRYLYTHKKDFMEVLKPLKQNKQTVA